MPLHRVAPRRDWTGVVFVLAFALLVLAVLLFPARVRAQLAPDTPRLLSPQVSGGLGMHVVRAGVLPQDREALLVTWGMPGLPRGMRLRAGIGRGAIDSYAVQGGIDQQGALLRDVAGSFDLDWQWGVGASGGDYAIVTVPVGLTGGVTAQAGSLWLAPYLTAGLAAEARLGEGAPTKECEVSPSLDVGLDLAFDRGRRFIIRTAASLGDRQAIAVGFALGAGRR